MKTINEFQREFRFLSNFWPAPVALDGVVYPSVEHAYVAAKTLDLSARHVILNSTPGEAKRYGRTLKLRSDWEQVKIPVMRDLVSQKFAHRGLAAKLRATGDAELIEGNTWGDTFWGVCKGRGQNHLGKILMGVREAIRLAQ